MTDHCHSSRASGGAMPMGFACYPPEGPDSRRLSRTFPPEFYIFFV